MIFKKHYRVELAKTLQNHWYNVWETKKAKEKLLGCFPSVTTILQAYPTAAGLSLYRERVGTEEADRKMIIGGERGTLVHQGIEQLISGITLYENKPIEGYTRWPTLDEYHRLNTFVKWFKAVKPKVIGVEVPIFSKDGGYAGKLDSILEIDGEYGIPDWKTSASIAKSFPLQYSAYAKAIEENTDIKISWTATLKLGASNKDGYQFKQYRNWKDHYSVFDNVRQTWQYDYFDSVEKEKGPPIIEVPESLSLYD